MREVQSREGHHHRPHERDQQRIASIQDGGHDEEEEDQERRDQPEERGRSTPPAEGNDREREDTGQHEQRRAPVRLEEDVLESLDVGLMSEKHPSVDRQGPDPG